MSERLKVKQVRRQIQIPESRIVGNPATFKYGEFPGFCRVCEVKSQRRCPACWGTAWGNSQSLLLELRNGWKLCESD